MPKKSPKPVRRMDDNRPLTPVKEIEFKTLNPVQVVDPKLTPEQMREYKQKLEEHTSDYVKNALSRAQVEIDKEYMQDAIEEEKVATEAETQEANERLAQILEQRGWYDGVQQGRFRIEAREKILPEFTDSIEDADISCDDEEEGEETPTSARMRF